MFKKDEKFKNENEAVSEPTDEPRIITPAPSPEKKDQKTIIGEHISIEGNIRGEEHLVIEGSMKGNIVMEKHNFALGSKGRFEGEIQAQNVNINGQMTGNIKTQGKVEIAKDADFSGDVKAKSISIVDGAYFKGNIELAREPHRNKVPPGKPAISLSPQPVSVMPNQAGKIS